jgi:methionyl aminopeptidase
VPANIPRPEYVGKKRPKEWRGSHVQTPETIEKMRVAGRLAAQATQLAGEHCKPGVTTDEIDRVVHEFLCDHGATRRRSATRAFRSPAAPASTR